MTLRVNSHPRAKRSHWYLTTDEIWRKYDEMIRVSKWNIAHFRTRKSENPENWPWPYDLEIDLVSTILHMLVIQGTYFGHTTEYVILCTCVYFRHETFIILCHFHDFLQNTTLTFWPGKWPWNLKRSPCYTNQENYLFCAK